jgi:mannosyl-3-phosphoglycerate phosphatase
MRRQRASPRKIVVFTDIDGTLADAGTFDLTPARPILRRLRAAGVPVVPVTSLTLAEMEPIARQLGDPPAMIIESGCAIARWASGTWDVEAVGPDADSMLEVIGEIEERSGADLVVYSALPEGEAARLSGLTGETLRRSRCRRFCEPFIIARGDPREVTRAAKELGFTLRSGRRLLYLSRRGDEGEAFLRVRAELRCDVAVALGDSPLDVEYLSRAEIPIVVPRPDGVAEPSLMRLRNVRVAPAPGTAGWVAAVSAVLYPETRSIRASRTAESSR